MTEFVLDLKQIFSEAEAKSAAQILIDSIVEDNVLKKQIGKDFLNKCQRNFQDQRAPAELKFYTLYIFKYFDSKQKTVLKIFSLLSGHTLFTYLIQTAKKVDPRKSIGDKGKNLFPDNKELGTKFMRLLLQSLKLWSERFPQNSNKQPTKYKKVVAKLIQEKVTFPETYIFYGGNSEQKEEKRTPGDPSKIPKQKVENNVKKVEQTAGGVPNSNIQQKQLAGQIRFLYNKIQLLIGTIEDQNDQSPEEIKRQITKNHQLFEREQKRLESSNIASIQDEKSLALYFKVNEFFNIQKDAYERQILGNDDLKTYCDTILLQFDQIFESQADGGRKSQKPKQKKPQVPIKPTQSVVKNEQKKEKYGSENVNNSSLSNKQNIKKYDSVNAQKQKSSKAKVQKSQQSESPTYNKKQKSSKQNNNQIKDKVLRSFFDSHLERPANKSKSGFKAIKESMEKQKKQMKANPVRGKSPHNLNSLSRSKFDASTVSKIKTSSIFANPPNSNPKSKKFDGNIVLYNQDLEQILYQIQKQQGMRRFKISHLKNRSLLFQNQHIQIGYKSQPTYDQLEDFPQIIQLQVYIGNKTAQQIKSLSISFQGDQKSLVYSNPQKIQEVIKAGQQSKFDVVIIPRHQTYSLIKMKISYKAITTNVQTSCILPSSILNFVTYEKSDSRQVYSYENSCINAYQTQRFKLSHYFPPRKIVHYIQELGQLTNYSDFAQNGSQEDFVLTSFVSIKDKYEGLLKINIRPDLNVILQLKSSNQSQDAQKQFKLYLQTLEMVLKELK